MRNKKVLIDALENRQLFASAYPIAMTIGDESLWDVNFSTVVAEMKHANVTSVKMWLGFEDYSDRPHAWDPDPTPNAVTTATNASGTTIEYTNPSGRVLKRIFELKKAGFDVTVTVQPRYGTAAKSTDDVRNFFSYIINQPDAPNSTYTLKDAVSKWEVGNEPDLGYYWNDSYTNINTGLISYVDKYLIPAAEVLHAAGEPVISGAPVIGSDYVYTILNTLKQRGKLDLIDYAGFHPYATYDPTDPSGANAQKDKVLKAVGYATKFGKPIIATEWNVRGYSLKGTQDATWAKAVDLNYRNVILPNFEIAYYFSSINNYPARGGNASARPAGLLKHSTTLGVTPTSSLDLKSKYYVTPVVANEPFYSVINSWQVGTVSGSLFEDTNTNGTLDTGEAAITSRTVYIDANNNGVLDATDPSAVSDASGKYTITYRTSQINPGSYSLLQLLPTGWQQTSTNRTVTIAALKNETGVNLGSKAVVVSTTSALKGTIWSDTNSNGLIEATETRLSGILVYLDSNNNNQFETGEPSAISGADGSYSLTYSVTPATPESQALRVTIPVSHVATTPSNASYDVSLNAGETEDGLNFGIRPLTGSVSGMISNDANNNGIFDTGDTLLSGVSVFIDVNNNATLDAGEPSAVSDSTGVYTLTYSLANIAAGNYSLRQIVPNGATQTSPIEATRTVTVAADAKDTGYDFASYQPVILPGGFSGIVWSDTNGNSILDGTEPVLSGRVVFIDANANNVLDKGEKSTTSAANGSYSFTGLMPGTYRVTRVVPSGFRVSTTNDGYQLVTITNGQTLTNINVGATARALLRGSVSAPAASAGTSWQVFIDSNSNNTYDIGEPTQYTDSSLNYSFTDLIAGTYRVRVNAPAAWKTSAPSTGLYTLKLAAGKTTNNVNFTLTTVTAATK